MSRLKATIGGSKEIEEKELVNLWCHANYSTAVRNWLEDMGAAPEFAFAVGTVLIVPKEFLYDIETSYRDITIPEVIIFQNEQYDVRTTFSLNESFYIAVRRVF